MPEMGIRYACAFDTQGGARTLEGDAIADAIRDEEFAWVNLDGKDPAARDWLQREISYLDEIIIDALLADETRPRLVEFEQGALLILRGVNLNPDADPEDMVSLRLWIDAHRVISVQLRHLKAVEDVQTALASGRGPKNAGEFLTMLSSRLFARMQPVVGDLNDMTDDLEERVIEEPERSDRAAIIRLRKQAIVLRRYLTPQRDVMAQLRASALPWLAPLDKRKLQESFDTLMRYTEDLEAVRDRAQVIKDELASALADRMNKNLYLLSVVAAIFLPLGALTGLMGINIGGMPGVDDPTAFWIFSGALTAIVAAEVVIFRWLRWI